MLNTVVRRVLHQYPFLTPRASLLNFLPDTPHGYGPFRICDQLTIDAYPAGSSDHVVKSLFWLGSFDPWVCSTLKSLVVPGTAALDIGANIGLMSMLMAQAGGSETPIHAFEPAPDTCGRLRSNVVANRFTNIHVHQLALSNRCGDCRLVVPGDQNGMARISDADDGNTHFTVPMTTIDAWLRDRSIGQISVCKIDVEGHEPQVLAGMRETLKAGCIDAVVFEDHVAPDDSLTQRIFVEHGFEIARMFKSLRTVQYVRAGDRTAGAKTADYVAVRPGTHAARIIESTQER